ncbi:hypothetical protein ACFR9U_01020 [Halorientalis brevis]|uniref:Holin n=1 Tax=Halorientalis brevis TaxID=1126241 RepID=A0ABD6C5Y1_9EURY|nr:hypothetical protein [Halorientalis brevis]
MSLDRYLKSVAEAFRYAIAAIAGTLVGSLEGIPVTVTNMALATLVLVVIILVLGFLDYLVQVHINPEIEE